VLLALLSMAQYFREFWSKLDSSIKNREHRRLRILERKRQIRAERRELRRLRKIANQGIAKLDGETTTVTGVRNSG
jgi:hypothetical protein